MHDVGSVQANRPFAVNELIGYFELRVTSAGLRGNIALGLTSQDFNIMRHPGSTSLFAVAELRYAVITPHISCD